MKNTSFKKYVIDGLLIVFSVLFALSINKLAESYKTESKKEFALESIKKELDRNSAIIEDWNAKHQQISERISSIVEGENDSLRTELLKHKFLNLGVLTNNESLINSMLTSTAWETSKATGIISEFDFEATQKLTYVYSMQREITEKTIVKILDFYFDMEAHRMENIDAILIQFQLRFNELSSQEYLLKILYKDAIQSIE